MSIRAAETGDVPALTAIQNALLVSTTYEWTETPHTGRPVLVAVDDGGSDVVVGEVVGWAAYGDFRGSTKWPGYLPTVEHTVHVRGDQWWPGASVAGSSRASWRTLGLRVTGQWWPASTRPTSTRSGSTSGSASSRWPTRPASARSSAGGSNLVLVQLELDDG